MYNIYLFTYTYIYINILIYMFMKWPLFGTHHSTPAKLQFPPGNPNPGIGAGAAVPAALGCADLLVVELVWSIMIHWKKQLQTGWTRNMITYGGTTTYIWEFLLATFFRSKTWCTTFLGNLMPESPPRKRTNVPWNETMFKREVHLPTTNHHRIC